MADVNKSIMIMIKGNADKLNKALGDSNSGFSKFAKGVAAATGALAGMAVGVSALNQQVADMVNDLVDASTRTGIAVDSIQALKLAAEGSGRSIQDMEGGLLKFQLAIGMASKGTGRQAENFKAMGVEVMKADGSLRSANDIFNDTIKVLGQMEAGTDRNIKVMELFGRTSGSALTQSGAIDAFDKYLERVRLFGVDVGPKARDEAAAWQRAVADMSMVMERALQDMVSALTGGASLSSALNQTTGVFIFMKSIASDVFNAIGKTLNAVIGNINAGIIAIAQIDFSKMQAALLMMANPVTMVKGLKQMQNIGESLRKTATGLNEVNSKMANVALDNAGKMVSRARAARKAFVEGFNASANPVSIRSASKRAELDEKAAKAAGAQKKEMVDIKKLQMEVDAIASKISEKAMTEEQKMRAEYDLQIERLKEIQELSEGRINTIVERFHLQKDLEMELAELQKKNAEEQKKRDKEQLQRQVNMISGLGKSVTGYMSSFATALKTTMENTGSLTQEQARKLHRMQQMAGIGEVWINAAVATMKAYAQFGPIGGALAAAPMSILAGVQTAAIISQPPPKFHSGGFVDGADVVNAQLLRGEAVLDRNTVRDLGGREGVEQIGNRREIIVTNSFKHFDRFLASSMRENSRIRRLIPASSGRR